MPVVLMFMRFFVQGRTGVSEQRPRDFDQAAVGWDDKPQRRLLAEAVAAGIAMAVPLHRGMRALEYGCGTGLVGLRLAERVGHLTAADTSQGMLQELRKKTCAFGLTNVTPLLIPPEHCPLPAAAFDLLFASMVLHHIEDTGALLRNFHRVLATGGYLALADLEAEDGTFHDHPHGIAHHGFDRRKLRTMLQRIGFGDLQDRTVHTICKQRGDGERRYPIFLMTGRKR
jgi:ubiquinone/menaquinone biosynthesis C-methylase UbiE